MVGISRTPVHGLLDLSKVLVWIRDCGLFNKMSVRYLSDTLDRLGQREG